MGAPMTEKPEKPLSERIRESEMLLVMLTPEGDARPACYVDITVIREIVGFQRELAEMMEKK